jgi:hypothetical protein
VEGAVQVHLDSPLSRHKKTSRDTRGGRVEGSTR